MKSCFVWLFATLWTVACQAPLSMVRRPEWVAISSSEESSRLRDQTRVPGIGKWILYHLSHQGSPDE